MPVEKWSESILLAHLGDDPHFSDDMESILAMNTAGLSAVLDFGSVHFVNSSNIADLLRLRHKIASQNGKLVLCRIGKPIWSTFLITGLDKIFEIGEDVPTSLATLQLEDPRNGAGTGSPETSPAE